MARIKTIQVKVEESGRIGRFFTKLAGDVHHIIGIWAGASTHHATLTLAEVCATFNGKMGGAIHFDLEQIDPTYQSKRAMLSLSQSVAPNLPIEGYVKDLGNAPSYPYTVTIYLQIND